MGGKKLYENIVIGNFLYALGFAVRAKNPSGISASVVNLLQQTPADTLLGDLLLEFPGVVRLIEFKAHDNRSGKELARHKALSAGLARDPEMQAISRSIHWYIESFPSEKGMEARIVPYLDAFPKRNELRRLESFIDETATEVVEKKSGISKEAAAQYLRWVRMTQGTGEVGSGGLLLVADTDGTLHYAQLLDLLELRLEHRLWIDRYEKRIERELEYQRELNRKPQRSLSRGYDIGGPRL
ncbi:hypothetical protein JK169_14095 [Acetobacter persici]|uniref:Uncharacterized protein n=2 Tax=Acetobacter TaxID=434 RepID=A0A252A3Z4_9PROT|nr:MULTISPECIES: hypothetical protein [Acetobacter]AQT03866.1 hypothetical protein A0U91_01160 [Acetobacter persici]MBS1002117.1 hypothetical protein [Acetobacter persici]OUI83737.1 hypothetical protein HC62_14415 [Acetobacter tropicalis]